MNDDTPTTAETFSKSVPLSDQMIQRAYKMYLEQEARKEKVKAPHKNKVKKTRRAKNKVARASRRKNR